MKYLAKTLLAVFLGLVAPLPHIGGVNHRLTVAHESAEAGFKTRLLGVLAMRVAARPIAHLAVRKVEQLGIRKLGHLFAERVEHGAASKLGKSLLNRPGRSVGQGLKENIRPVVPREWEKKFVEQHGRENVRSNTLPLEGKPNVKLAGNEKFVAGERVVFDQKGFPVFDNMAKFDSRLKNYDPLARRDVHMKDAMKDLREANARGQIDPKAFTPEQWKAINNPTAYPERIPGLTWHHHQDRGRMQLVPSEIHQKLSHVGGFGLHK